MNATYNQIRFSDSDVVNTDDFIANGDYNPHNIRPFLVHEHGFTVGIAFAESLQDALDELADAGKLDGFQVSDSDLPDYGEDEDGIARLGNAGEPFDIQTLDAIELPTPGFSFVALFNHEQGK